MTKKIDKLARDLAINQTNMSMLKEDYSKISSLRKILNIPLESKVLPTRNIIVIGAGCSFNAYPNLLPLGKECSNLLESYFEKKTWPTKISEKAEEIAEKIDLPMFNQERDFETKLSLLSHFFKSSEVRSTLGHLFSYRTLPNLFFEVVAHLLKNRFIEGVINFNFDELLDQAIDEEVGLGQLHKILSDGDCIPYRKMLTSDRLKVPFYIKPHGTISHKSTLRFTKEQYIDIPDDIEVLMEELLSGQSIDGDVKSGEHFSDINLIICGFHMQSHEFNRLLIRAIGKLQDADKNITIYFLNHDSKDETELKKGFVKMFKNDDHDNRVKIKMINLVDFTCARKELKPYINNRKLDCFAITLMDKIRQCYKVEYRPKEILRHMALVIFFKKQILESCEVNIYEKFGPKLNEFVQLKDNLYFNTSKYYFERTLFEVIIVVLKNNGYIQPAESLKGDNRVGIYFDEYVKAIREESRKASKSLKEISIYDILTLMGLKSNLNKAAKDFFYLNDGDVEYNHLSFEGFIIEWIQKIQNYKLSKLNIDIPLKELKEYYKYCQETLIKFKKVFTELKNANRVSAGDVLVLSDAINLYPNYKDLQLNMISRIQSYNVIPTSLAFVYRFRSLLYSNKDWKRLHIVTDRGLLLIKVFKEMAKEKFKFNEPKVIYLIISNSMAISTLNDLVSQISNLRICIFRVPYYDHNRHMIYFDSDDIRYLRSIYFYKKGYSNNVNAVYLEGKTNRRNIDMIFVTFKKYLAKAIYFENTRNGIRSVPYFKQESQMNKIIRNYNAKLTTEDKRHFLRQRENV